MTRSVADHFITLRGLTFHYRDWGGEGQPIVLLHGLASTCHIWDLVAPLLTPQFQVMALDQRGHGETDQQDSGYDFASVTEDLHAFTETLGVERSILVGHSWGGNVALQYAVTFPGSLTGLVLVDGGTIEPSSRPGYTWERAQQEMTPPDFTNMTVDDLIQRATQRWLGNLWSPEMEAILLANFHIAPSRTISPRLKRENHMQIVRALWEHKPSELYSNVRCPALLVPAWQEPKDERTAMFMEMKRSSMGQALALIPHAKVLNMEDTIHDIPLHRPQELAKAILGFAQEFAHP